MSEQNHTPGPWIVTESMTPGVWQIDCSAGNAAGTPIRIADGLAKPRADQIVHAVNAHDELLAALTALGQAAEVMLNTDWAIKNATKTDEIGAIAALHERTVEAAAILIASDTA